MGGLGFISRTLGQRNHTISGLPIQWNFRLVCPALTESYRERSAKIWKQRFEGTKKQLLRRSRPFLPWGQSCASPSPVQSRGSCSSSDTVGTHLALLGHLGCCFSLWKKPQNPNLTDNCRWCETKTKKGIGRSARHELWTGVIAVTCYVSQNTELQGVSMIVVRISAAQWPIMQ